MKSLAMARSALRADRNQMDNIPAWNLYMWARRYLRQCRYRWR